MEKKVVVWTGWCEDCETQRTVTSTGAIVSVVKCYLCGSEIQVKPLNGRELKPLDGKKKKNKDGSTDRSEP